MGFFLDFEIFLITFSRNVFFLLVSGVAIGNFTTFGPTPGKNHFHHSLEKSTTVPSWKITLRHQCMCTSVKNFIGQLLDNWKSLQCQSHKQKRRSYITQIDRQCFLDQTQYWNRNTLKLVTAFQSKGCTDPVLFDLIDQVLMRFDQYLDRLRITVSGSNVQRGFPFYVTMQDGAPACKEAHDVNTVKYRSVCAMRVLERISGGKVRSTSPDVAKAARSKKANTTSALVGCLTRSLQPCLLLPYAFSLLDHRFLTVGVFQRVRFSTVWS